MTIFGIGTDIVSIDRIKNSLKNKNFVNRILMKKKF
jgi:phosphopantetheinyl transferase (holo-ACP synthase)